MEGFGTGMSSGHVASGDFRLNPAQPFAITQNHYYAFNGLQIEESPVPEPKSWALVFLGLGSLVTLSRIRKFLA